MTRTFLCPAMIEKKPKEKSLFSRKERCLDEITFEDITQEHQVLQIEWWEEDKSIKDYPPKSPNSFVKRCTKCNKYVTIAYETGSEVGYRPILKEEKKFLNIELEELNKYRSPIESYIGDVSYRLSRRVGNNHKAPYRQLVYESIFKALISLSIGFFFGSFIGLITFEIFLRNISGVGSLYDWVLYWLVLGLMFGICLPIIMGLFREVKRTLGRGVPLLNSKKSERNLKLVLTMLGAKKVWVVTYLVVLLLRVFVLSLPGGIGTWQSWIVHVVIYFVAVIPEWLFIHATISILLLIYVWYGVSDKQKTEISIFLKSISIYETLADVAIRLTLIIAILVAIIRIAYLNSANAPDLFIIGISSFAGSAVLILYFIVAIFPLAWAAYFLSRGIERYKKDMIYQIENENVIISPNNGELPTDINQLDKIIDIVRKTPNRLYYFDIAMRIIVALIVFIIGGSVIADIMRI